MDNDQSALTHICNELLKKYAPLAQSENKQAAEFYQKLQYELQLKNTLLLKPIEDLKGYHFRVDSYQRGYKWGKHQVEDLLEDVEKFDREQDSFYCLQPVVVKYQPPGLNSDDQHSRASWELIDGQQRMTTIYLIFHHLKQTQHFDIRYETRIGSAEFLAKYLDAAAQYEEWEDLKATLPKAVNTIDSYHFFEAYKVIRYWFEKRDAEQKEEWLKKLLSQTQVIWYAVYPQPGMAETDSRDIFMRLNSGKIPLTNAELIKALLLQSIYTADNAAASRLKQMEVSRDWDDIERHLQDDEFWSFININAKKQANTQPTRIEFILDLYARESGADSKILSNQEFALFQHYEGRLGTSTDPQVSAETAQTIWLAVKQCYYQLREWYDSSELYHLSGFLLTRQIKNIHELRKESSNCTKTEFQAKMRAMIGATLSSYFKTDDGSFLLEKPQYGNGKDNKIIENVLVLFEIYLLGKQQGRISFKTFPAPGQGGWSLEHIHAQNARELDGKAFYGEQMDMLEAYEDNVKHDKGNVEKLRAALKKWHTAYDEKSSDAAELLKQYREHLSILVGDVDDEYRHAITNLTLLNRNQNSSLSNSLFALKRQKIQGFDRDGAFIPLATKHIFAKYFSPEVDNLNKWNKKDRKAYKDKLLECLYTYLPEWKEEHS